MSSLRSLWIFVSPRVEILNKQDRADLMGIEPVSSLSEIVDLLAEDSDGFDVEKMKQPILDTYHFYR